MTPTRIATIAAAPVAGALFLTLWIVAEAGRMRLDPLAPEFGVVTWLAVVALVATAIAMSTQLPRVALVVCGAVVLGQLILPPARFTENSWPVYFGFLLVVAGAALRSTGRLAGAARWYRLELRRLASALRRVRVVRLDDPASLPPLESLSAREHEILLLAARGLSNSDIARAAFISEATVKSHMAHILGKLGMASRAQLVAFAWERGLVSSAR